MDDRRVRYDRGLWLRIHGESASWVFRYTAPNGKRREMGLGAASSNPGEHAVNRAKIMADEARAMLASGIDPIDSRADLQEAMRVRRAADELSSINGRPIDYLASHLKACASCGKALPADQYRDRKASCIQCLNLHVRTMTKARSSRLDKASVRVRSAMCRISRDRYIPADEVKRISQALAHCASAWNISHSVAKAAVGLEAMHTGMLRGEPARRLHEPGFHEFAHALRGGKFRDDLKHELTLLSLELRYPK